MIVLGARTRQASFLDAKKLLMQGFVEAGLEVPAHTVRPKQPPSPPAKTKPAKSRMRRASRTR
jgi:hypothetical protein